MASTKNFIQLVLFIQIFFLISAVLLIFRKFLQLIVDELAQFDIIAILMTFEDLLSTSRYLEGLLILLFALFVINLILIFLIFLYQLLKAFLLQPNLHYLPDDIAVDPQDIAVVIPAYNEGGTIESVIRDCERYSNTIIIVNDGSSDNTAEILAKYTNLHVLTNETNQGLGKTMKKGVEYAAKLNIKVIVTIDADGQYRAEEIPKLAHLVLFEKADLALGSRFAGKIETMPFIKRLGNRMMTFAVSAILGLRISDGQTGFRGISKLLASEYRLRGEYTYTQEMILQARFLGKKIIETPIFFDKRVAGESRLISSSLNYAWCSWITIFRTLRDFYPFAFYSGYLFTSTYLTLIIALSALVSLDFTNSFSLSVLVFSLLITSVQSVLFLLLSIIQN